MKAKVSADEALSKKAGLNGTPSFLVNGTAFSGAQPFEKFKAAIDAELAKAEAKLAEGVPKSRLYGVLSKENFKAPTPKDAGQTAEVKDDSTTVWKVPVAASPFKGSADAPVTIDPIVVAPIETPPLPDLALEPIAPGEP